MATEMQRLQIVRNARELLASDQANLRLPALDVIEAGVRAGDPGRGTREKVVLAEDELRVDGRSYQLAETENIYVVGAGKGSLAIAAALEDILGTRIAGGVVAVKCGEKGILQRIEVMESGHPTPDDGSVRAAARILEITTQAGVKDLVIAAITGGASALATIPADGISLEDVRVLNDLLLRCGAPIQEINKVRRHVCRIKGGRLVAAIQPAQAITLTLNTAPERGPWPDMCLADPTTFADAINMLEHFALWERTPESVRTHLCRGTENPNMETVKDVSGMRTQLVYVGDPVTMCDSAARRARELGFEPIVLATQLEGESREAATCLAGIAKEIILRSRPFAPPCALITGGETTVTVACQGGRGGPSQEFVLAFANHLTSTGRYVCAALDTDGTDGPTEYAGGIVDDQTVLQARKLGLSLDASLKDHDCLGALLTLKAAIFTGHTGTNLLDLRVILIDKA